MVIPAGLHVMSNPEKQERFSSFSRLAYRPAWPLALMLLFMAFSGTALSARTDYRQPLIIDMNTAGCLHLRVALASDPAARQTGLMHRQYLPENAGMLFDYRHEQSVQMWMKNTLIPLDMLFIDNDGRIVRIVENTEPGSQALIDSGQPVRAVLELNAGSVKKYGIQVGHRVQHPIFDSYTE